VQKKVGIEVPLGGAFLAGLTNARGLVTHAAAVRSRRPVHPGKTGRRAMRGGELARLERFPVDVNRNVTGDSLGLANQIRCHLRLHAGAYDGEGILQ
jgi:hypothetical protein